jgi:hypothetical protein
MKKESFQLIEMVFGEKSNINFPAAYADLVIDVRTWVQGELKKMVDNDEVNKSA